MVVRLSVKTVGDEKMYILISFCSGHFFEGFVLLQKRILCEIISYLRVYSDGWKFCFSQIKKNVTFLPFTIEG